MRFLLLTFAFIAVSFYSLNSLARDTTHYLPIDKAMASSDFKEKLSGEVAFYFAGQGYPQPIETKGEYVTNKKTNAFGKSDEEACEWVLLSALISLQERALVEGGNAVVDIVSYYKRNEFSSDTEYECHAGAIMAGVALQGRVVTLP